jgi:hypothetical protein
MKMMIPKRIRSLSVELFKKTIAQSDNLEEMIRLKNEKLGA